ncbi:response regulator receiver protein [Neokomagataea thailandica NBRC 106555]|uniref:Response regulator n=2 Tax=Neokomagataea TaxID=1223423 RepID=A0A4Y6V8U3_9PROT|nr:MULTISPECIES: response regulator [Neokomagataea]QDH25298.1 response regulator [Neokomagataea tanensis]GBR52455.1 response regulator receiver protein [Neokomagataea thailandica NBRC 106555]
MNKSVFLVEDELLISLEIEMLLTEMGLESYGPFPSCHDALAGLANIGAHKIGCAILDVKLTDGDALPLARIFHQHGIPIIFSSGHANNHYLEQFYPPGKYISKPFDPSQMKKTIDSSIKGN